MNFKRPPAQLFDNPDELSKLISYDTDETVFAKVWERALEGMPKKNIFTFSIPALFTWSAGFAAAFVIIIGVLFQSNQLLRQQLFQTGQVFLVYQTKGEVYVQDNGKTWKKVNKNDLIHANQRLQTKNGGFCQLAWKTKTGITLLENTDIAVRSISDPKHNMDIRANLNEGKLLLSPDKLKMNENFIISAGLIQARVTGTLYSIENRTNGSTKIAVLEGHVLVSPVQSTNDLFKKEITAGKELDIETKILTNTQEKNKGFESASREKVISRENVNTLKKLAFRPSFETDNLTQIIELQKIPTLTLLSNSISQELPAGKMTVWADNCYLAANGKLYILDKNGTIKKQVDLVSPEALLTKPVIDNNRIYIGSDQGGIFTLNHDGKILWQNQEAGQERYSAAPALSDNYLAIPSADKGILILNKNGAKLDQISMAAEDSLLIPPLFLKNEDWLAFGSAAGQIAVYDIKQKKSIWSNKTLSDGVFYPLCGNESNIIILSRYTGKVSSISSESGSVLWENTWPELKKTAFVPYCFGDNIYLTGQSGSASKIFCVDLRTGKLLYSEKLSIMATSVEFCNTGILFSNEKKLVYFEFSNAQEVWNYELDENIRNLTSDKKSFYFFTVSHRYQFIP